MPRNHPNSASRWRLAFSFTTSQKGLPLQVRTGESQPKRINCVCFRAAPMSGRCLVGCCSCVFLTIFNVPRFFYACAPQRHCVATTHTQQPAVPCIAARPDKPWLAFWLASVSGLAEPAGAIVALSVLHHTRLPLENVLASVAGVMCMVAVMELYPEAVRSLPSSSVLLLQQQQPDKPKRGLGTVLRSYRPILWGTLVGMAMMVTTEWYL